MTLQRKPYYMQWILSNIKKNNIDLIVFLQCTSPLRLPTDIDSAIEQFFIKEYDSFFSISKIDDLTLWSEIIIN